MAKLNKFDSTNLAAIVLTVVGIILEVVGGIMSVPETVGLNTSLNVLVYVGIAVIVIGLAVAIAGSIVTEKLETNKVISSIAIYLAVVAVMFAIVYLALTMAMPLLNPTNG